MAAALASVPSPHRHRPTPRVGTRPSLRVLDGGRSAGELISPAPRAPSIAAPRRSPSPTADTARRVDAATYRRRRIGAAVVIVAVLAVSWLAVLGAASLFAGSPADASGVPSASIEPTTPAGVGPVHVVAPGDTLWSIAAGLQPDGDVRALVDRLAERSGGGPLQAGQRIPLDGLVP